MAKSELSNDSADSSVVTLARSQWLAASENASRIATSVFQEGSGYGDPDACEADLHRLQTARDEAVVGIATVVNIVVALLRHRGQ